MALVQAELCASNQWNSQSNKIFFSAMIMKPNNFIPLWFPLHYTPRHSSNITQSNDCWLCLDLSGKLLFCHCHRVAPGAQTQVSLMTMFINIKSGKKYMKQQFAAQLPWKLLWNNGDIALLSINTLSLTTYISLAKLDPFKHAVGYKIKRKKSKFICFNLNSKGGWFLKFYMQESVRLWP